MARFGRDNEQIGIGIDIGASKVAVTIGQKREGLTNVLAIGTAPSSGLRRGIIIDSDEVISSLSAALEDAHRKSGIIIDHAMVGISGVGTKTLDSKSIVAITSGDEGISVTDIDNVTESARAVALPPNYEIIHSFPIIYTIDNQEQSKDPLGMKGTRLEGEILVVGVPSANVNSLVRIINQADISLDGLIFSPLASARAVLNKKQKEQGVLLLDIGAGTTGYAVFEEGDLIDTNVLPIGSSHITNDIAIGLKTTLEIAERVKTQYVDANPGSASDKMVDLSKIEGDKEEGKFSGSEITTIVDARLKELFAMVRKELKKIKRDAMLPAGAVLTGGGAKLKGIVSQAKENLELPAQIGIPSLEIGGAVDKLDDPSYATSIGLMLQSVEYGPQEGTSGGFVVKIKNAKVEGLANKARNIIKQFLP
ncbi:cell division protein FtsA [Patescibacteria group bacterium]|nr:cell division protein FtsA [Patescibacteria group bacterium]